MKPWITLESAETPSGKPITLVEHDGSYTIRVGGDVLMSTLAHSSEDRLAELTCPRLANVRRARILIGGLGCGFTLQAALATLPRDAEVVVAEILPCVVAWNRNPAYRLGAASLKDPRVTIVEEDVMETIRRERGGFDAILLDVDNGPAALTSDANSRLYEEPGLESIRQSLRPGGCAAFWSAGPDRAFEKLLAQAGFRVEIDKTRARKHGGRRHLIFLASVPGKR
jgi:spermidine synthase